jgi:hypothetical protein
MMYHDGKLTTVYEHEGNFYTDPQLKLQGLSKSSCRNRYLVFVHDVLVGRSVQKFTVVKGVRN